MLYGLLLAGGFAALVAGALVFTNAAEWAGARLGIGHGAVGSVLAAVATAMPESLIPVVAIIRGDQGGPIAVGAIVGAPFLLGTLAMALCGVSAVVYRTRRARATLRLDRRAMARDLLIFIAALSFALVAASVRSGPFRVAGALVLVAAYTVYLSSTILRGRREGGEPAPDDLLFDRGAVPPRALRIGAQTLLGVGLLVGGAELFVAVVEHLARSLRVDSLVLTLLIAPLATELPEKVNSVVWIRQGKDTLALGNVTGALVFQSMLPVAVGMAFTDWRLAGPARVAAACALGGAVLALVATLRTGRFSAPFIASWTALYAGAVIVITMVW